MLVNCQLMFLKAMGKDSLVITEEGVLLLTDLDGVATELEYIY